MTTHSPAGPPRSGPRRFGVLSLAVAFLALAGCGPVAPKPTPKVETATHVPVVAASPTPPTSPYVVIRLAKRRLELMEEGAHAPVASFPIAVGRAGHETPTGRFQVEELVEHPDFHKIDPETRAIIKYFPPGPLNPLGERWIGFAHGEGWTLGIHGTPNPELLGKAVSGGCIRMRNADVLRVWDVVELGTPVIVHP